MIIRASLGGIASKNVPPPLDISGMPQSRLAYGIRKLRAAYTGAALRVRRSSDNTEADVYFSNSTKVTLNSLTSAGSTLRDFIGANTAFVTKWYNQSGNTSTQAGGSPWSGYPTAPDAIQTTTSYQAEIITSGSMNDGISFGTSSNTRFFIVDEYRLPNANTGDSFTLCCCFKLNNHDTAQGLITNLDNFNDGAELISHLDQYRLAIDSHDLDHANTLVGVNMVAIGSYDRTRASAQGGDGQSQIIRVNGSESTKDTDEDKHIGNDDRFRLGVRKTTSNPLDGNMREVIVFESQLSQTLQILLERNMAIFNQVDLT
tara:strand:+ start:911 stop:1858 length:948 start_codon:yes stop_codon:yes gene_type:complete